jgi:hypothetical protein
MTGSWSSLAGPVLSGDLLPDVLPEPPLDSLPLAGPPPVESRSGDGLLDGPGSSEDELAGPPGLDWWDRVGTKMGALPARGTDMNGSLESDRLPPTDGGPFQAGGSSRITL